MSGRIDDRTEGVLSILDSPFSLLVLQERLADLRISDFGFRILLFLHSIAVFEGFHKLVHLAERCDAGDRLLAERPGESDGAKQLAVNVDGAAAHPGDDAGFFQPEAGQPAQNHVPSGTSVLENSQHFDVEGLDLGALHDRSAKAFQAGPNVIHLPITAGVGTGLSRRSSRRGIPKFTWSLGRCCLASATSGWASTT